MPEGNQKKISLPEIVIFGLFAFSADIFEAFSLASFGVPVIGQVIWILALFYGFLISAAIFLWSMFKDVGGRYIIKLLVGFLADSLTGGFFPIRTIVLAISSWTHNKHLDKYLEKAEKAVQFIK